MLFHPDNGQQLPERKYKPKTREVGCMMYVSPKGEVLPVLIKMKDDNQEIRTYDKVRILYKDEKNYAGTRSFEFHCEIVDMNRCIEVVLHFFPEKLRWELLL